MKVLIIQLRRIGDILLTTPVISYLKQAIPECEIDFLAELMGLPALETNPHLREVLTYDRSRGFREIKRIRYRKYDAVLDFMNNPRTSYLTFFSGARWRVGFKHAVRRIFYNVPISIPLEPEYVPLRKLRMVKAWLHHMGATQPSPMEIRPRLYLSESDQEFAQRWLTKENVVAKQYVVMVPAHRHPIRSWRKEGFRQVGLELKRRTGMKVFLSRGPGEEAWIEEVRKGCENDLSVLPLANLREVAAIFKQAALVLSNDSGAMHTAVAVGTPTVTIYGPSRPIDWNPSLARAEFLENRLKPSGLQDRSVSAAEVACLGCHLRFCPVGHLCMERLTADHVSAVCDEILHGVLK